MEENGSSGECLLSKQEALISNPSAAKENNYKHSPQIHISKFHPFKMYKSMILICTYSCAAIIHNLFRRLSSLQKEPPSIITLLSSPPLTPTAINFLPP
jgi:hypothetical protein